MARELPQAPKWAWVGIAAGVIAVGVMAPIAVGRGDVPQAEIERINAEPSATAEPTADAPPPPLAITWPDGEPLRVLFAGDSLTKGSFAREEGLTFRSLVTAQLEQRGPVEPERIGTSGVTAIQVLPEVAPAGAFDVVVVELGTNDVTLSTPAQFAADYPVLLDAVRAESPSAALFCAGVWNNNPAARAMDETIQAECEARGGRFVPLRAVYENDAHRGPEGTVEGPGGPTLDDFHPNTAGHAAIAEELLGTLAF